MVRSSPREYTYDAHDFKGLVFKSAPQAFRAKLRNSNTAFAYQQYHIRQIRIIRLSKLKATLTKPTTFAKRNLRIQPTKLSAMLGYEPFKIKYELCEIILCDAGEKLKDVGSHCDGRSVLLHHAVRQDPLSFTDVRYLYAAHHELRYSAQAFSCQARSEGLAVLRNSFITATSARLSPKPPYPYMGGLARKYLKDEIMRLHYKESLYSMKPILQASEIDDSRPTVIRVFSEGPDVYLGAFGQNQHRL